MKDENWVVVLLHGSIALAPHKMKITEEDGFARFLYSIADSHLVHV